MNIAEVNKLLDAGFSAEEIRNFTRTGNEDAGGNTVEPEAEVEQTDNAPVGNEEKAPAWADAITESINHLVSVMQASNSRYLEMPAEKSAQDIVNEKLGNYLKGGIKE